MDTWLPDLTPVFHIVLPVMVLLNETMMPNVRGNGKSAVVLHTPGLNFNNSRRFKRDCMVMRAVME